MVREVVVAVTQFPCSWDVKANLDEAEKLVREAAAAGANIILLQELFRTPYFCQEQKSKYYDEAEPFEGNSVIARFSSLAKELGVVLPVSFFEKAGNAYFNSLAMVDADGTVLGLYRKTHIPDGPGYQEKWYFSPGDTGIQVFSTKFGKISSLICWDQWFPEGARCAALLGAELVLYPTAIGSEPPAPEYNSYPHWVRTMQGHAAANVVPVVASNRIGTERFEDPVSEITFYGGSFIADPTGAIVAQVGAEPAKLANGAADPCPTKERGFVTHTFDFDAIADMRRNWGLFRDRRPEHYWPIATLDGQKRQ